MLQNYSQFGMLQQHHVLIISDRLVLYRLLVQHEWSAVVHMK
jgi:hypothetical protein